MGRIEILVRQGKKILNTKHSRYFIVGIWNAFFSLSFYFLLLLVFSKDNYQIALFTSYVFSTIQAHFTQRKLVWHSRAPYLPELAKFAVGVVGQYFANAIILFVAVEFGKLTPFLAQPAVALIVALASYFYNQKHVFKGVIE